MNAAVTIRRGAGFAWQMPFSRRELAAALAAMRDACGLSSMPLDVTLTDDAFIARANAEYLGCSGPTNILSFPPSARAAGILLLSLDTLRREALLYGQDATEHALRLFAHGIAHLAGLNHGAAMDALQDAAFAAGMRERDAPA